MAPIPPSEEVRRELDRDAQHSAEGCGLALLLSVAIVLLVVLAGDISGLW